MRSGLWLLLAILVGCVVGHEGFGKRTIQMEGGLRQANGTGPPGCASVEGVSTFANPTYTLAYKVDCDLGTVEITMTANTVGWVAFGIGQNMFDADVYLGILEGGVTTVTDRKAITYDVPAVDPSQDIIGTPTSVVNGAALSFTFVRPLDSGDAANDKPIVAGNLDIIFAFGTSNALFYHGGANRADGNQINFFEGGAIVGGGNNEGDFRLAHGILMLFSWIFVITTTVYLARYLKDIGPIWFRVHQIANWITVLISLAAWIEIVVLLGAYRAGGHHILGTIIIAFSIAQPILGTLADKWFDPNRSGVPIFPDRVHNWLGRLTILCTWVQNYLGFCAYGTNISVWIVYSIWLILIIIIQILSQILVGSVTHDGEHKGADESKLFKGKILFGALIVVNVVFWIVVSALMGTQRADLVICVGF